MLKVFLVEDEFVIREGIKNNVLWSENGFIFCGEASDGELAYSEIHQKKPDIIITDIKMPFMNGLELSRLVKKDNPDAKIIILSGYGEFELAKEAINIGIEEYLLKPINADDLLNAVKRVAEKIRAERQEKENLKRFIKEMEENEVENKRKFFNDLINSNQSLSNILDKGNQLGIELLASYYNIVLFKVTSTKHGDDSYSNRLVHIKAELSQYFEHNKLLYFDRTLEGMALLLKANSQKELEQMQKVYLLEIERIIRQYEKVSYFGGTGCIVNRLSEIYISFEEASRAFAYRFILKESQFLDAGKIGEKNREEENPWGNMADTGYLDKEIAEKFLRIGELGEVNYFVEEYLTSFAKQGEKSILFRQYIIMDMYFITANFIEKLGKDEYSKKENPFQSIQEMNAIVTNFNHTITYIKHLFTKAITYRNEAANKKFSNIIEETKAFINQNYKNEEMSLNTTAAFVNISPSYLSSVFSQETGQTFVKYLTDMRMNKAKELLTCTNKRSNEISMEIGYKDPHYFSYLFKKTQGCSPLQYRMNISGNFEKNL